MALFLSTFENKIDKKGRVSVPAQFRASLSSQLANQDFAGIIVYESFVNDCIEGCDIARIKQLSESIDNLDPFSESRDSFAASILGGAIQLSFDGDGRVILPESLIKKIGLQDRAVFIGKGATFEIWQPVKFAKYLEKAKVSARENRGQLKLSKKD
ncbi:MAG: MraZ protein [Lentimonas sp.]|jgi:MraZ protein